MSIKRRQTFSTNETTLSISASLGSLISPSPGFAPDGAETPGTGSPRDKSSFFTVAFSPCRRAISVSSAERSSGTTLQAQPASLRLHCETCPVRVLLDDVFAVFLVVFGGLDAPGGHRVKGVVHRLARLVRKPRRPRRIEIAGGDLCVLVLHGRVSNSLTVILTDSRAH